MIKSLHIENYVLIDRLDLEFESGLNIITGETGAGKSILLGAIALLMGAKSDSSAIMEGASSCVIEGVFDIAAYDLQHFFDEHDLEHQAHTTLRRVITPSKSRLFVNDLPVNQTTVRLLSEKLIDIHSQNQSRMLDSQSFQMAVLDSISGAGDDLLAYQSVYDNMVEAAKELSALEKAYHDSCREEEFLRHQYGEIADAGLVASEQAELESQQKVLSNSASIKSTIYCACDMFSQNDSSIISSLKSISNDLAKFADFSPELSELATRVESALFEVKDIDRELSMICDNISDDPAQLEQVETRLDRIYTLQQKYHLQSVEELIAFGQELAQKLSIIDNSSEQIEQQQARLQKLESKAQKLAAIVTKKRNMVTGKICKNVVENLALLGMESSAMAINVEPLAKLNRSGADSVVFSFSANRGAPLAPISKISGGEMSRLMLTLKSLVASHMNLPTIIFDEIDTGVSGRVADAMGSIIVDLSSVMQIINITHLPQVAAKGDHHFYVYKEHGDATRTRIIKLDQAQRIEQIAAMLSGSTVTEAAMDQAKELLNIK